MKIPVPVVDEVACNGAWRLRRGKGVAMVQSISDNENQTEEIAFMKAVVEGLRDLEKGKVFSAAETKAEFGIK
jgi:hypothetical protein